MSESLHKNEIKSIAGDKKPAFTTTSRISRPKLKHFLDVKQTVNQSSPEKDKSQEKQNDDKCQPLRACGCAFKFSPSRSRTLSYRHKASSKSDDKLNNTTLKERSKSCTPLPNEKFTLTNTKRRENQSNTIVRFSSENDLNKHSCKDETEDNKLILVPEVYGEHRFQTTFWWEPRALPYKYSTSVYIDTNSAAKYYVEEVSMKIRLVPCPYVESLGTLHRYKSTVEADIQSSTTVVETTFHLGERFTDETII